MKGVTKMEKVNQTQSNSSQVAENLVYSLAKLPIVKIQRENFLKTELSKYYNEDVVNKAISLSVKEAEIPLDILDRIADNCIRYETNEATLISVAAGMPGGLAMIGTIPADAMQFYAHVLRLSQKLAYIYGWDDFFADEIDDGTKSLLMIMLGISLGVDGSAPALAAVAKGAANQLVKKINQTALTKTTWYPLLKQIAKSVGIKVTKSSLSKTLSKIIPVLGGLTSGGLTRITFKPMGVRLKKHLRELY